MVTYNKNTALCRIHDVEKVKELEKFPSESFKWRKIAEDARIEYYCPICKRLLNCFQEQYLKEKGVLP